MAPNRRAKNDHHGGNHGGPAQRHHGGNHNNGNNRGITTPIKCCRPKGCLDPKQLIYMEDVENGSIEVIRVTCNNMQCEQGNYMHLECFNEWEEGVLNFLSSTGRARSWSVKQRQQNLWTKKGYDLAFKACDCMCSKGHLRKDLDWIPPTEKLDRPRPVVNHNAAVANPPVNEEANQNANNQQQQQQVVPQQNNNAVVANPAPIAAVTATAEGKKKKKKATKELPSLSLSAPVPHLNDNHGRKGSTAAVAGNASAPKPVNPPPSSSSAVVSDAIAMSNGSSGIGSFGDHSTSPPLNNPWNVPDYRPRVNSLSSNASGSSGAFSGSSGSPPSPEAQFGSPISANSILTQNVFKFQRKNSNSVNGLGGVVGDRIRHNSTGSLFSRRNDFSSFNILPRTRQNSYCIKMDDDGHGNEVDSLRFHILATLQNQRMTKVSCCMCRQNNLTIYDRYPLIDGTFFLSPRKYFNEAVPMTEGGNHGRYLTAICMHCLSGKNGGFICRGCGKAWDGTTLVLGGCYSYDVFAAQMCCRRKVECGNCKASLDDKAPTYFSQASQLRRCFRCGFTDFHYAKPLEATFDRYPPEQFQKMLLNQKLEEKMKVIPNHYQV